MLACLLAASLPIIAHLSQANKQLLTQLGKRTVFEHGDVCESLRCLRSQLLFVQTIFQSGQILSQVFIVTRGLISASYPPLPLEPRKVGDKNIPPSPRMVQNSSSCCYCSHCFAAGLGG